MICKTLLRTACLAAVAFALAGPVAAQNPSATTPRGIPAPVLPPGFQPEPLPLGKPGAPPPVTPSPSPVVKPLPPPVVKPLPPPIVQPPPAAAVTIEMNVNRPGSDYRNFTIPANQANPQACQQACLREAQCVAFTYVLPGLQGPDAVCWLKNQVPAAIPSQPCCVSGIRVRRP